MPLLEHTLVKPFLNIGQKISNHKIFYNFLSQWWKKKLWIYELVTYNQPCQSCCKNFWNKGHTFFHWFALIFSHCMHEGQRTFN